MEFVEIQAQSVDCIFLQKYDAILFFFVFFKINQN